MILNLLQLGRISYEQGLRHMREIATARREGRICDTLLLMEHPPVLTLGRNASRANILATADFLAQRGIEVHEINRGGDITYHGPGQLVGYPIVDLRGELPNKRGPHLGPVDFVRLIEEALILTCKDFGVLAQRITKRTGVWTHGGGSIPEKKVAAIGIHVAQGITTHGFALNVTTDLRDFEWIVPCGIADRGVTSLEMEADPSTRPTLARAADAVSRNIGRVLHRQIFASSTLEMLLNRDPGKAAAQSAR